MQEPIGLRAQRRARNRNVILFSFLIFVTLGAIVIFMLSIDVTQNQGASGIVRGTGIELDTVFWGPDELEVRWDNMMGKAWSVSLVEGRVRNISNRTVKFDDIIYRVKDDDGRIIWEHSDGRFDNGGRLGLMQYFNFVANPITKRESRTFEVVVINVELQ